MLWFEIFQFTTDIIISHIYITYSAILFNWKTGIVNPQQTNGEYPSNDLNGCGDSSCEVDDNTNNCQCEFSIKNSKVFNTVPSSREAILSNCVIGGISPDTMLYESEEELDGFTIYYPGTDNIEEDTVFGVEDDLGRTVFFKNMK